MEAPVELVSVSLIVAVLPLPVAGVIPVTDALVQVKVELATLLVMV
jgi:hypothetical protein